MQNSFSVCLVEDALDLFPVGSVGAAPVVDNLQDPLQPLDLLGRLKGVAATAARRVAQVLQQTVPHVTASKNNLNLPTRPSLGNRCTSSSKISALSPQATNTNVRLGPVKILTCTSE